MTLSVLGKVASRFPLVARTRPPARPLRTRIDRLRRLAESAVAKGDRGTASKVFNGAALLASDCGASGLAADWCRWHARTYLDHGRLDGDATRFALEPLVNLGRLRTRAGDGDGAFQLLTALHESMRTRTRMDVDGVELHADRLAAGPVEHRQVVEWLRTVLLADGTRALVIAGRWADALDHVQRHQGLTPHLHEGRQSAVIAHLIAADNSSAAALLDAAECHLPWEQAVHATLAALCRVGKVAVDEQKMLRLLQTPLNAAFAPGNGLAVFRTRLGLCAVDLAANIRGDGRRNPPFVHLLEQLCRSAVEDEDGNAARDLFHHPALPDHERVDMKAFMQVCHMDSGAVPDAAAADLIAALRLAAKTIRNELLSR